MLLSTLLRVVAIALVRIIGRLRQRVLQFDLAPGTTTLIADAANHRVIEVDGANTILWQYGTTGVAGRGDNQLDTPRDTKRLSDGRTLIADTGNNRVIEVTRTGTIVWSYVDLQQPRSSARLANGHTLIADLGDHRVIEVNEAGAIQWSYGMRGVAGNGPNQLKLPRHAERLPNGNTLIADHWNRVIEVTREGTMAWDYALSVAANGVTRLENGNTLMAVDGGFLSFGVLEVSASRMLEWSYPSSITSDAKRLPNGNTLIAIPSRAHVIEVDRDRNIVWQHGITDQPGAAPGQLSDPWEASRLTQPSYRPDLAIRLIDPAAPGSGTYTGVGVYGSDGVNQTVEPVYLNGRDEFACRLVNAGVAQGKFTVTATWSESPPLPAQYGAGWAVRFYDALSGGTEITPAVTGAGWTTPFLAPGDGVDIRIEVKTLNRGSGERLAVVVTSRSVTDPSAIDAVKTITVAPRIL
jgi:hypothetical protein